MAHEFDIGHEMGEVALQLPGAIRRALAAHDTLGFCTRLLRLADQHARAPAAELPDLTAEREAVGLDDATLEEVVTDSRLVDGALHVAHLERLNRTIIERVDVMIAAVALGQSQLGVGSTAFRDRFQALLATAPAIQGDLVPDRWLELALEPGAQGLQGLVDEVHQALGALQQHMARDTIAGAAAYGLQDEDRPAVASFMAGFNRTAPLLFDERGLECTVTRSGGTLILHVDLGRGEPHAIVLRITGSTCQITYADPHLQRFRFLQGLLTRFPVQWTEARPRETRGPDGRETYYLSTGSVGVPDAETVARLLEHLGSRLVFLVDWNRARKRLRSFVDGPACLDLLRWAADQEVGHRAFLELGGERLVYDAIEGASPTPVRYGQRLDAIVGREAAVEFLRFVLRTTANGLLRQRSERFIRDELRADLLLRFETLEHGVLAIASEHAVLIGSLAGAVRGALAAPRGGDDGLQRTAMQWEKRADELVERVRTLARRSPRAKLYARLIGEADDAADELEEAAFLLALPAARTASPVRDALLPLVGLLVDGAGAWKQCLQASALVTRGGAREDLQGFLEAVEHVVMLEHQADDAERQATAILFGDGVGPQQLLLYSRVGQALEQAADALARGALLLRDHFLTEVMAG